MIQQNELITFLVGIGVAFFIFINRRRIKQIPGSTWLFLSYSALFAGWTFTVLEGFAMGKIFNLLEHACYLAGSITAAFWCWIVFVGSETER
jgi:hypothetical protein